MADSPERPTIAKLGILKQNITQLAFFSRKFKELFTIYFYCKICAKDLSCSDGGASVLWDIVSLILSLTKKQREK